MMTGLILSTLLLAPAQGEKVTAPKALPAIPAAPVEPMRTTPPTAAEVALPLSNSGCPSCNSGCGSNSCGPGGCYGATCDKPDLLGPPNKGWFDTSYIWYWYKPSPQPTLLTTGINGVTTRLNSSDADFGRAAGGRISGGLWVNDAHTFGYGWSGFITEQRADFFSANSAGGNPALSRPFINALDASQLNYTVSSPGAFEGTFRAESGLRLAGGEVYALKSMWYCPSKNFQILGGFRYLDLDEYLVIFQQTNSIGNASSIPFNGAPNSTSQVSLVDRFRTRNQFYGMEFGGRGEWTHKCFSFGMTGKVGLGNIHQTLDIAGQTISSSGATATGGLLALSSNIGRVNFNRFGALAECSAEISLQVSEGSRFFVAYDFFYLNDVIRPGSQIDRVINTQFLPTSSAFGTQAGAISPVRTQAHDDFFAYGLRFGYQLQY